MILLFGLVGMRGMGSWWMVDGGLLYRGIKGGLCWLVFVEGGELVERRRSYCGYWLGCL